MKRKTSLERSFDTVSFRYSLRMGTTSKKDKTLVDPVFKTNRYIFILVNFKRLKNYCLLYLISFYQLGQVCLIIILLMVNFKPGD